MRAVQLVNSGAAVAPLPLAPTAPDILTQRITALDGQTPTVEQALRATHTDAFLVAHEGNLVCEWYAAPEAEWALHPLHSITKSFVGVLAGQAIAGGLLDPDQLAASYVPDLTHGGYATATVRDLLDMRTGGDYVEVHEDPNGELATMGSLVGWLPSIVPSRWQSLREWVALSPQAAAHEGPFSYRSLDTEALAWVIEAAVGSPFSAHLSQALLAPLALESNAELTVDPAGFPLASGGLSLRPRDVVRFGQMLLNGGSVGEVEVIPATFLRDTRQGQGDSVAAFRARVGERIGLSADHVTSGIYRNQFWVPKAGGRQLLCLGVHGQALLIDGDNHVVALKLSSWPNPQDPTLFTDSMSCLSAAAEIAGGRPAHSLSVLQ